MQMLLILASAIFAVACIYFGAFVKPWFLYAIMALRIFSDGTYSFSIGSFSQANTVLGTLIILLSAGIIVKYRSKIFIAIGFVGLLTISCAWASLGPAGNSVWDYFFKATSFIVWWIAVSQLPGISVTSLLRFVMLLGCFSSAFSIWQFATRQNALIVDGAVRIGGLLAHPNSAALVYSISICCIIGLLAIEIKRTVLVACLLLNSAALVLTVSLMGLATIGVILFTYFSLSNRAAKKRGNFASFAVVALAMVIFLASPFAYQRLSSILFSANSVNLGESNSLEWRLGRWQELLPFWQSNPIFGLGYGSSTSGALLHGYPPHNDYLRLLVDVGLVGTLLLAVMLAKLFKVLSSGKEHEVPNDTGVALRVTIAVFVGFLVNSITENTFTYAVPVYILGLLVGRSIFQIRQWHKNESQVLDASV